MRRKAPWFPFYAADWNGDEQVRLLSLEAQGAYVRLLAHSWIEGSIPADPTSIGVLLGDRRLGKKLWPALARFWEPKPGEPDRLVNPRLERERKTQVDYSAEQKERGRIGNESRARQRAHAERLQSDAEGVASAHASAHPSATANGAQVRTQVRAQVGSPNGRSVQSEPKPERDRSLSVHPSSTQPPRPAGAERASLSSSSRSPEPSNGGASDGAEPEKVCSRIEDLPQDIQEMLAALKPRSPQQTESKRASTDATDRALAGGVYGEEGT